MSLEKQQFVVAHTVPQKEIPALLENWITNTPSVECFIYKKIVYSYIFVNT